uniref:Uncharacterized protein n=1 Tax=Neogobius melanostomus TaxID=47308 RepID=A0A8C6SF41_9GOBI
NRPGPTTKPLLLPVHSHSSVRGRDTTQPPLLLHQENEPPWKCPDHFIWSLCCFLYSNPFCLGLAALIHSVKVSSDGDIEGARGHGTTPVEKIKSNIIHVFVFCYLLFMYYFIYRIPNYNANCISVSYS